MHSQTQEGDDAALLLLHQTMAVLTHRIKEEHAEKQADRK